MKTRRNIWPFGTNQPLGPRVSYGKRTRVTSKSARPISSKMAAKQERESEASRRARILDDPNIERKLHAWYAKGKTFNEYLAANPGTRESFYRVWKQSNPAGTKGQFQKCVDAVSAKGGAYDPRAVCAAMERKKGYLKGRNRNPAAASAEVYEEFHGMPSTEIVEVTKRVHFHSHLAALGKLERLVVQRGGYEYPLRGFGGAKLCCNERKNQLFVEGGKQKIPASAFGYREWPHEKNTLGVVSRIEYFTTKKHLGSEGGTAIYFHEPGEPERGKSAGVGPDLIYDAVNEALEFSGGTYTILAEGISR